MGFGPETGKMRVNSRRITAPNLIVAVFAINGFVDLMTGLAPISRVASYPHGDQGPEYLRMTPGPEPELALTVVPLAP